MITVEEMFFNPKYTKETKRIINILRGMRQRCCNPNDAHYRWYGGKGITICDEWMNGEAGEEAFVEWAIQNGYLPTLTIDRIDPEGNYEPSNCRWATKSENSFKIKDKAAFDQLHEFSVNNLKRKYPEWA